MFTATRFIAINIFFLNYCSFFWSWAFNIARTSSTVLPEAITARNKVSFFCSSIFSRISFLCERSCFNSFSTSWILSFTVTSCSSTVSTFCFFSSSWHSQPPYNYFFYCTKSLARRLAPNTWNHYFFKKIAVFVYMLYCWDTPTLTINNTHKLLCLCYHGFLNSTTIYLFFLSVHLPFLKYFYFLLHFKGDFIMDNYLNSFREMISLRGLTDHTLKNYCTWSYVNI